MTDRLTLRRPDDWHLHLRDGALLRAVLPYSARQFARAIVMPNLVPPITTVAAARDYARRIRAALPEAARFMPLMTCYLTDDLDKAELERGWHERVFVAAKLYPAHATTNAAFGVTDVARITPLLETMARLGMPLLVHGEVVDHAVDVFDREAVFIERVLAPLVRAMPELKVVFEHVTTEEAVVFVQATPRHLAATITAHHLVINRNALFQGGLRPHAYCLPVAKRERHRLALRRAATSGDPRFFLGTDSAPHRARDKEAACGCAGIFSAPVAIESYAAVFDEDGALDRLEGFASLHGPAFYGLPPNPESLTLVRHAWTVPATIGLDDGALVPFHAGETLAWQLAEG
jgi:dihydroorotase